MREVLIDITRLLGRSLKGRLPTGVDRVGLAYIQHYQQQSRAVIRLAGKNFVLAKTESDKLFQWLLKPHARTTAIALVVKGLLLAWNKQNVAGCFLFNTGHSGLERKNYSAMLRRQQVRPIFVIHDLIPITHPAYCRLGERERHITRMNNALVFASGIIANSQSTLNELSAFAASKAHAVPLSTVALLAPGMTGILPSGRPIASPYFVMLSTIEPRKNHKLLLKIWCDLVARYGEQAPRLLVIGQRGWDCEDVVELLERCDPIKDFVMEISTCSDSELVTYLHHAQALLFPSFVEGYGMPLVEALAHGTPVIASDLAVFREVAGEIPEYLAPLDSNRWSEFIIEYAQPESPRRKAQLLRMKNFSVPMWTTHFAKVDELLNQLDKSIAHV